MHYFDITKYTIDIFIVVNYDQCDL